MFKNLTIKTLVLGLIMGLMPVFAQTAETTGEVPLRLVLGMVPSREADRMVDSLEPIARLLSERLLIPVETFVSTNYTGLVEALGTGRIDIGMFGPSALVQAMDRHGAEVILASVRSGSTTYLTQFSVATGSDIQSFEDLRGRTIAFVDPASASGYQVPFLFLRDEVGIDANTEMEAIFAGSHDAAMLALYNGDVDVAVTFNDARTAIQTDFPDVMERVRVLGYSSPIPNDGLVVRAGLDPELVQLIADTMIEIAASEEGRALTQALFNVTAFAPIESEFYDVFREVVRSFQR